MKRIIPDEKLNKICKMGQGHECCRYITVSSEGFECAKGTLLQKTLDFRASRNQMTARGNNCKGINAEEN